MKPLIRLRTTAEADVADCARFLHEEDGPALAIRFLDAVDATFSLLQSAPEIGGKCQFSDPQLDGVRVWPVSVFRNYLIFYRFVSNEIEVIRLLHGARDLDSIFTECEL